MEIGDSIRRRLAGFVRTLRDNGFAVGLAETRDALKLLASPMAGRAELLRQSLKALFCATHSDWEKFDEIFDAYWLGRGIKRMRPAAAATISHDSPRMPTITALAERITGAPQSAERSSGEADEGGHDQNERTARAATGEAVAKWDVRKI